MLAFPMLRHFRTATACLRSPSCWTCLSDAPDTNLTEVAWVAAPNAPNMGRYRTGCGVGMDALVSPITLQAMNPPLMIISGLTPKKAGLQTTRSARFLAWMDLSSLENPCAIACLIV